MKKFSNAVAVITGAASGIGYACAEEAVNRGMRVVAADIRPDALAEAAQRLKELGGTVVTAVVDVCDGEQIRELAAIATRNFGGTNLLINNAGVFAAAVSWEVSAEQFEWFVRANLLSVAHGIREFVPAMIASGQDCHVVNVASASGLVAGMGTCLYGSTKHAVVALTESLAFDLMSHQIASVGATLVMPGYIDTDVMDPEKVTAGTGFAAEVAARLEDPVCRNLEESMRPGVDAGMSAAACAAEIFAAIENGHLYVRPNIGPSRDAARVFAAARIDGDGRMPYARD